jgi:hypothetical protein
MADENIQFPASKTATPAQPAQTVTPEQAKAAVAQDKAIRRQRYLEKLAKAGQEERCQLEVGMLLRAGRIDPQLDVIVFD